MINNYLIKHIVNCTKELQPFLYYLNKQAPGLDGGIELPYYTFNYIGMGIFLEHLKSDTQFSKTSLFLDVGSGRGNTVFCVANEFKPIISYGIEADKSRHMVNK
jgi:hypothetical protein